MSSPESRGWGRACHVDLARVRFSNGASFSTNRLLAPLVKWLGEESIRRGYGPKHGQCGSYNCRTIRGASSSSHHSWATAIDWNWNENPMGSRHGAMPHWFVDLWESKGFEWGGYWRHRPDWMHLQFGGTPQDAAVEIQNLPNGRRHVEHPVDTSRFPPFDPANRQFGLWPLKHPKPTLHDGARGDAVRYLQAVLQPAGAGPIDGRFGSQTTAAVRRFQQWHDLTADGWVGRESWPVIDVAAIHKP